MKLNQYLAGNTVNFIFVFGISLAIIITAYLVDSNYKKRSLVIERQSQNILKEKMRANMLTYGNMIGQNIPIFSIPEQTLENYHTEMTAFLPMGPYDKSLRNIHVNENFIQYLPVRILIFGFLSLIISLWIFRSLREAKKRAELVVQDKTYALAQSEQQFRNAIEYSAIGMALVSQTGSWLKVNRALSKMFGFSEDELLEMDFQSITHPDDLDADMSYINQFLDDEIDSAQFEKRFIKKSGDIINVYLSVSHVKNQFGQTKYFIVQVQDITGRKKIEEEMLRSNAELERFAYIASHDLQEPLRMIRNFTELFMDEYKHQFDQSAEQYLGFITDASTRMQNLISDLLEYSKADNQDENIVKFDAREQIENVLKNLKSSIQSKDAKIQIGDMPIVKGNPIRFSRLMQNLIGNALKYSDHGRAPNIQIEAEDTPTEWLISVKDNGIGIKQEYLDQVFVIFKRLHNKDQYSGTGIGLSICQKIVNSMGGHIWVESKEGEGSTFFYTLPKPLEIATRA